MEPVEAKDALNCICIIVLYAKQTKKKWFKSFQKSIIIIIKLLVWISQKGDKYIKPYHLKKSKIDYIQIELVFVLVEIIVKWVSKSTIKITL